MKTLFIAIRLFLALTVLTGVAYPLVITVVGQSLFHHQANGSLVSRKGVVIGSNLIGQKFTSPRYFHSRASAVDYNPMPSGGSNLSPISKKLVENRDAARSSEGREAPADLLYASASGVDPHISIEAALFQIERVARARNFSGLETNDLKRLVAALVHPRDLGFLGEPTVNVLQLNLALDEM